MLQLPRAAALLAVGVLLLSNCGSIQTGVRRVEDAAWVGVSEDLPASRVRVYRSHPAEGPIKDVWIVMAGTNRNADRYRDYWADAAAGTQDLILAPELPEDDFPGANGYNLANMIDEAGDPNPPEEWAFRAIDDVFADAREEFGFDQHSYRIFGHSAGAQFVTRMVTFAPTAQICHAYAANAGWYTVTDDSIEFPYGLADAPPPGADLPKAFVTPMTLLLGARDTDSTDENLRQDEQANAQGENRLERGQHYYDVAAAASRERGTPLAWTEEIVPGVDHDGQDMSLVAHEMAVEDPRCW